MEIMKCEDYLRSFQAIEDIRKKVVVDEDDDVKNVLDGSAVKFKLFTRHHVHCCLHRTALRDAKLEVMRSVVEEVGILTIDYKMKFDPKKYRQMSSDWYGRKGITWHGSVLPHKKRENERNMNEYGEKVELPKLSFDHICRNDSSQKAYAVCFIIQLVCRQIRREVSELKKVVIHSDNAGSYSKKIGSCSTAANISGIWVAARQGRLQ